MAGFWRNGIPALALLFVPLAAQAGDECAPDRLDLRWPGHEQRFSVELADTPDERALGLMNRPALATDSGMLFVYESPRAVHFWMKDTLIPLDMVFADGAGRVTHVHANAVPGDLTPIPGGDGVQFVLEINGGQAAALGIAPGAEIRHPAIRAAAWPC